MNGKVGSKSVGFYSVMEAYGTATNYPSQVESYRPRSPPRTNTPPSRNCDGHTSPRNVSFGIKREEQKDKRQKYLTARYGQHQMMLIRKRLAVEDWVYESLRDLYNCEANGADSEQHHNHHPQPRLLSVPRFAADKLLAVKHIKSNKYLKAHPIPTEELHDDEIVLYNDEDDHDCKLDLEDILNLDADSERQQYATETLSDAKQTSELVNKFITELLQKAKTL